MRSKGALCGSVYVDRNFEAYFRDQVGAIAFDNWVREAPQEWFLVKQKWENIKCSFSAGQQVGGQAASPQLMRKFRSALEIISTYVGVIT